MNSRHQKIIHYIQVDFNPEIQGRFSNHRSTNISYHINVLEDRNLMAITIDKEKGSNKI